MTENGKIAVQNLTREIMREIQSNIKSPAYVTTVNIAVNQQRKARVTATLKYYETVDLG